MNTPSIAMRTGDDEMRIRRRVFAPVRPGTTIWQSRQMYWPRRLRCAALRSTSLAQTWQVRSDDEELPASTGCRVSPDVRSREERRKPRFLRDEEAGGCEGGEERLMAFAGRREKGILVAWGGIEPPTQGFSILCSTD
jgi:hypothetical protein